jgi:E3 ubiquitin-protein ligase SHPRH
VDDLNGELAFLGVWPFCLSDQTDGFWAHRVGKPWAAKEEEALTLLHALLRGVIVRHTKAQRRVEDNTPLLTLPPAGREWRAVQHGPGQDEAPSERYVCAFLEHHAAAAARGALATLHHASLASPDGIISGGGGGGNAREMAVAKQRAEKLMRLVRSASTSATLVRSHLKEIDAILRAAATQAAVLGGRAGAAAVLGYEGRGGHRVRGDAGGGGLNLFAAEAAAEVDFGRVRALHPAQALVELMQPREANAGGSMVGAVPLTRTLANLRPPPSPRRRLVVVTQPSKLRRTTIRSVLTHAL